MRIDNHRLSFLPQEQKHRGLFRGRQVDAGLDCGNSRSRNHHQRRHLRRLPGAWIQHQSHLRNQPARFNSGRHPGRCPDNAETLQRQDHHHLRLPGRALRREGQKGEQHNVPSGPAFHIRLKALHRGHCRIGHNLRKDRLHLHSLLDHHTRSGFHLLHHDGRNQGTALHRHLPDPAYDLHRSRSPRDGLLLARRSQPC